MRLLGPNKPKFEESAQLAEKTWKNFVKSASPAEREHIQQLFSTEEGRQTFFSAFYATFDEIAAKHIAEIRETKDRNQAIFSLHLLSDLADTFWVVELLDGLSDVILRQRELMLKLLDAISERSEQKINLLKEEMQERTLTPEQREVVDSILKAFKESQDRLGEKR